MQSSTAFEITVHEEEAMAPRFRVLRSHPSAEHRWITVDSFATRKQAEAFARGMTLGFGYGSRAEHYGYAAQAEVAA